MSATAVEVKEMSIAFSASEIYAVLSGRKTMKRVLVRVPAWLNRMKPDLPLAVPGKAYGVTPCLFVPCADGSQQRLRNPYNWPDVEGASRLWVREGLRWLDDALVYDADSSLVDRDRMPDNLKILRPHLGAFMMPRWASRITLEITHTRVERLQDITCEDVMAEGSPVPLREHSNPELGIQCVSAKEWFAEEWDKLNAKRGYSWASNPWVFVITFQKL